MYNILYYRISDICIYEIKKCVALPHFTYFGGCGAVVALWAYLPTLSRRADDTLSFGAIGNFTRDIQIHIIQRDNFVIV